MTGTVHQDTARTAISCAVCREGLSAQLDGETAPVETALHVAGCDACAAWAREIPSLLRPLRMQAADDVPDLTERILAALIGSVPRPSLALSLARASLMAVAIVQAVFGAALLLGAGAPGAGHGAAESGAWNVAAGIALATAALRHQVAYAVLPMVASLVGILAVTSLHDLAAGTIGLDRVLSHSALVAGLVLVSSVAWRMRRPRSTARARTTLVTR